MLWTRFDRSHFEQYLSWYKDPELNRWLGPMDEEWLDAVMNEEDGIQYAIFDNDEFVAVLGITYGSEQQPFTVITDIAINPAQRRKGIGSRILAELNRQMPDIKLDNWVVYIDPKNHKALTFFKKHNWIETHDLSESNDMIRLKANSLTL